MTDQASCPICLKNLEEEDVVKIHQKGADGINVASAHRGDANVVSAGCNVHSSCRKKYTNSINIDLHLKRNKKVHLVPLREVPGH